MIKVSSKKPTTIGFRIEIQGNTSVPLVRFIIKNEENVGFVFKTNIYDDKVMVNLPPLNSVSNTLVEGDFNSFLEVIVDESYFIPWEGQVSVSSPVQVKATVETDVENKEKSKNVFSVTASSIDDNKEESFINTKKQVIKEENKQTKSEKENKSESDFFKFLKNKGLV